MVFVIAAVDDNPLVVGESLADDAVDGALQAVAIVEVYGYDRESHYKLTVKRYKLRVMKSINPIVEAKYGFLLLVGVSA